MNNSELYRQFISSIKHEHAVLGLVVAGSYAKGLQSDSSDLDLYFIVEDNTDNKTINELKKTILSNEFKELNIDISNNAIQTLADFDDYAVVGSKYEWDRYNLLHTKVVIDKTDDALQKILTDKAMLSSKEAHFIVDSCLGAYINLSYRSIKSADNNQNDESLLAASESLEYMLGCLFALKKRVRPFNEYLRWELEKSNLKYGRLPATDLYNLIIAYARAEPVAHKRLYHIIKNEAVSQGFGNIYNAWGKKLAVFD